MISVVIPCYNAEDDVGSALESVLRQTRDEYIHEIIVVDDGSTDGSEEVIRELARQDERIQYLYQENAGPSVARNTGVEASSQEYIAFLDADDCWLKRKIEFQSEFLSNHPGVGLLYSDAYTKPVDGERRRVWATHLDYQDDRNLERLFAGAGPLLTPTVVMRRQCFEQVGGFDSSLPVGQDEDLWLRIAGEYPIHHLSEPLVLVRKRKGSVASNAEKKARYRRKITKKIINMYPKLESIKNRRYSHIEYFRAVNMLSNGEKSKSISSLVESIRLNPVQWKGYIYIAISVLPFNGSTSYKIVDKIKCFLLKFISF